MNCFPSLVLVGLPNVVRDVVLAGECRDEVHKRLLRLRRSVCVSAGSVLLTSVRGKDEVNSYRDRNTIGGLGDELF